jgi:hypothetical protein
MSLVEFRIMQLIARRIHRNQQVTPKTNSWNQHHAIMTLYTATLWMGLAGLEMLENLIMNTPLIRMWCAKLPLLKLQSLKWFVDISCLKGENPDRASNWARICRRDFLLGSGDHRHATWLSAPHPRSEIHMCDRCGDGLHSYIWDTIRQLV